MTEDHVGQASDNAEDRFVFFWGGFLSQWQACVMATDNPREQKMMGQRVAGFDDAVWEREREGIVFRANDAKFAQNAGLRKKLLRTAGKILAEASPQDTNWGIGLAEDDPDVADPSKWRGQNLLGKALMAVRERLEREASG